MSWFSSQLHCEFCLHLSPAGATGVSTVTTVERQNTFSKRWSPPIRRPSSLTWRAPTASCLYRSLTVLHRRPRRVLSKNLISFTLTLPAVRLPCLFCLFDVFSTVCSMFHVQHFLCSWGFEHLFAAGENTNAVQLVWDGQQTGQCCDTLQEWLPSFDPLYRFPVEMWTNTLTQLLMSSVCLLELYMNILYKMVLWLWAL